MAIHSTKIVYGVVIAPTAVTTTKVTAGVVVAPPSASVNATKVNAGVVTAELSGLKTTKVTAGVVIQKEDQARLHSTGIEVLHAGTPAVQLYGVGIEVLRGYGFIRKKPRVSNNLSMMLPATGEYYHEDPHRYWRVRSSDTAISGDYMGCAELEMMNSITSTTDLTTGKIASASAALGGYPTSQSINNNTADFWTTGGSAPPGGGHWLSVDLTTPELITKVTYRVRGDSFREDPLNLFIEYSDDGSAWTNFWSVTPIGGWVSGEARTFVRSPDGNAALLFALYFDETMCVDYMGRLTATVSGNASHSTSTRELTLDGTGDYLTFAATGNYWRWQVTTNWTLEFHTNAAASEAGTFFGKNTTGVSRWVVVADGAGNIAFYHNATLVLQANSVLDGTWKHFAIVRTATTGWAWYVNGVSVATTTYGSAISTDTTAALYVGADPASLSTSDIACSMARIKITHAARYNGAFIAPLRTER